MPGSGREKGKREMADKPSMGPAGSRTERTYRAEGAITRGMAVIPGTAEDQVKAPANVATGNLKVVGIAAEAAASGEPVRIVTQGEVEALAGAAVAHGDILKTVDVDGACEPTTTDNDGVFAQAVSDADADGDFFIARVFGPNRY
jgi:hypothetical protein